MKISGLPLKSKIKDFANTVLLLPERLTDVGKSTEHEVMSPDRFNANRVAAQLHPKEQLLEITGIETVSADFKRYTFRAADGRTAYFRAGQYLSFRINIGSAVVTRAYSISSSPADALENKYQIAVKRAADGFVSGYILDEWKTGDRITAYAPEGTFVYESLRDAENVIGVAGGSGITPFLSFAKAIDEGTEDFSLTLLYGARTKKDLAFRDELDEIAKRNKKFRVVYVLSDSRAEGFEHGFITSEIIKKYAPKKADYSIFACGPEAMYDFLKPETEKLGLRRKFIRFEMQGVTKNTVKKSDLEEKTFSMTVINRGEKAEFTCEETETVLVALEKAGVTVPVRCRSGECGFCRSRIISGNVFIPEGTDRRRIADAAYGYIHPCCTYPLSDIVIKIN